MAGKTHYQKFEQWSRDCAILFGGSSAIKETKIKFGQLFRVENKTEILAEFVNKNGQVPSGWIVNKS